MILHKEQIAGSYIFIACTVTFVKMYVLFAYLLGTSVAVITSIFFLGNIAVIYYGRRTLVKKKTFIIFGVFLVLVPYFFSIINFFISPSALLLQLFYLSQILVGAIAVVRYKQQVKKAIIAAVILNLLVGIVSIVMPALFAPLSEINASRVTYGGRAIGFFLQPNTFGVANVVLMIAASVLCSRKTFHYLYPLLFVTTAISFSRSAIGLFFITTFILLAYSWLRGRWRLKHAMKPMIRMGGVVGIGIILFLASPYSVILDNLQSFDQVYSRIEFFMNFNPDSIIEDASLEDRADFQRKYIEQLPQIFPVGKGLGSEWIAIDSGALEGKAHMTHLQLLYEGGVYYWISFIIVLCTFYYFFWKNKNSSQEKAYFASQILIFMIVFSLFSSSMLAMRELYLVMGLMIQFRPVNSIEYFLKEERF
ncbi:MAG: hypothetical protein U5K72_12685 [Balneolaceae bacterium]|nr:hypothetical protein [Balneolaceae bacterium]